SFRRAFMGGRGNVLDGDCGHRRPPSTLSLTQLLARLTPARAGGSLHERLSTRVEISRARARRGTPGILAGFEVYTGVGQKLSQSQIDVLGLAIRQGGGRDLRSPRIGHRRGPAKIINRD